LKKYPVEQEKKPTKNIKKDRDIEARGQKMASDERETCHSNAIFFVTIEPPFLKCSPHCSASPILFVLFVSRKYKCIRYVHSLL